MPPTTPSPCPATPTSPASPPVSPAPSMLSVPKPPLTCERNPPCTPPAQLPRALVKSSVV
eukprot:535785-Pelagomonas_calceolata.AAC.3